MNGRVVTAVAVREIVERARSRAFQVSVAIMVGSTLLGIALPAVLADDDRAYRVAVVGTAPAGLKAAVEAAATEEDTEVALRDFDAAEAEAYAELRHGELDALLVGGQELVWRRDPLPRLDALLRAATNRAELAARAARLGLTPPEAAELLGSTPLATRSLEGSLADRESETIVATVGLVLLFVSINFYGSFLLVGVVEEKQNRVVEVLLARIPPEQLLAGKVLGIGLLGLAQLSLLAVIAVVGLALTDPVDLPPTTVATVAGMVGWFVLGYAFYSVVYAAVGSMASRMEDAQTAIGPLLALLLGGYFLAFAALSNPDGWMARVGSFLPPTAPLVMPIRIAVSEVAAWEVVLAVALTAAGAWAMTRLGGRLYRGALLRIGPKVRLRDAWRASA